MQTLAYSEQVRGAEELYRQEKISEARLLFARALASEPENQTLSRAATGIVLTFQEPTGINLRACKAWTQENISTDQGRRRVDLAVGEFFYRQQDYDRAIAHLEDTASRKGHLAESASLVLALCLLGKGDRGMALVRLNQVATTSSSEETAAKAIFLMGWTHLQAQQYAAAKTDFDRLARNYPENPFTKKAIELSERLNAHVK